MKMAVPLLVVTSVVVCIAAVLVAAFLIDPPTTTSSSAAVAFSSFAAFCRATGHHLSALMGQMQPFNGHSPSPKENQQLQM
ncbi:hypothetical protein KP509_07G004200 [Ceratopteris richardii]|uniref:Uncharacterized protein n=1 Tax=Ceratopteris richardii TaxID=49495 RepID=A0A8T2UBK4_CERRI|nr:hypothetical protein KP509_07G004200 [Ceratopteris richardii]